MDIYQVRWTNFRTLADEAGGITKAALKLGKAQSQVSHFGGDPPSKNIGDQIAREIEQAFGKPHGWLDSNHATVHQGSQSVGLDAGRLHASIQFLEQQFSLWQRDFVAAERTTLIAAVYARLSADAPSNLVEMSHWLADQLQAEKVDVGQSKTGSTGGNDRKRTAGGSR